MIRHEAYRNWELGYRDAVGRWHEPWGRDLVRDNQGLETVAFAPCPICDAVPRWHDTPAGFQRLKCVHSARRHRIANVPVVGDSTDVYAQDADGRTVYRFAPHTPMPPVTTPDVA